MKNIKIILMITLAVIGFVLLFWGAIQMDNYPGMKEMRKAAFAEVRTPYIIGLVCMGSAWLLTFVKKRF